MKLDGKNVITILDIPKIEASVDVYPLHSFITNLLNCNEINEKIKMSKVKVNTKEYDKLCDTEKECCKLREEDFNSMFWISFAPSVNDKVPDGKIYII